MNAADGYWWYITINTSAGCEDNLLSLADISGSIGTELQEMPDGVSRLRMYYKSTEDISFWRNKLSEAMKEFPGVAIEDSGKIENWGIEANIAYRINAHWQTNANYSWLHMEYPVISAPEHKLYAGVDFTHGRWSASTGVMYVAGLYTSVGETVSTEDFVLWNLRAACRICRHVSLYVKGENLLAQRYEIMAGYPMPGATFTRVCLINVTFITFKKGIIWRSIQRNHSVRQIK